MAALEDAAVRHKHRLLERKDSLDKEAFFIDELYRALQGGRYEDLHTHRHVLRDLLPAHDYALVMSLSTVTERELEDLHDRLALALCTRAPDRDLAKDACRVLLALFQQGCAREDYYASWARKLYAALRARPDARQRLLEPVAACLWKIEI
ncbi:hypothetical protein EMCLV017L [Equine molluscum contagiosum-like virus]|nr:hypothetical protein EMCLV017L [Equine molluscum contagiosum-like virus]